MQIRRVPVAPRNMCAPGFVLCFWCTSQMPECAIISHPAVQNRGAKSEKGKENNREKKQKDLLRTNAETAKANNTQMRWYQGPGCDARQRDAIQ